MVTKILTNHIFSGEVTINKSISEVFLLQFIEILFPIQIIFIHEIHFINLKYFIVFL